MSIVSDQALTPDDFQQLVQGVEREAARLSPGWVAAAYLRAMGIDDPFINEQFGLLQKAFLAGKACKIATLLDSDPLKMRLGQSGAQTRSTELTRRFHDPAEWERLFSEP